MTASTSTGTALPATAVPTTIVVPRLLLIGGGAGVQLGAILKQIGVCRPLVVTDPFIRDSGILERVVGPLRAAGLDIGIFADTVPDPTTDAVDAGAVQLRAGGFDSLIALGGGSPIDTAKAMSILGANRGVLRDYKVPNPIPHRGVPVIAIPTTAGTGSEVTRFTVITDSASDEKMLIAGLTVVPEVAIVDYELTLTMPWRLTADTGIDSLTHAIEAYVSRKASPFTDTLALAAMARIARHLRTACTQPDNREAREQMMLGATQAGMAFSNASVALVHGMSRPIGAHFHVPHGLSNAMLLPTVTAFSLPAARDRYAACARAMGIHQDESNAAAASLALIEALQRLNADLKVPSPQAYGIDRDRYERLIPLMTEQALASGSPANNPRVPSREDIAVLYRQAYV
ncbi:MAG: iron-containing alcohol dehydrogenase [Azospirillaceae bacterium]|nr:iron-containing alcohol dehydrogenase [Azospirillaceae bacterium]